MRSVRQHDARTKIAMVVERNGGSFVTLYSERGEYWGADFGSRKVGNEELREIVLAIDGYSKFQYLSLASTAIDDRACSVLVELTSLDDLDISDTMVTNSGVKIVSRMPMLYSLNVANTSIDDESVEILISMQSLRIVDLRDTRISQEGIDRLVRCRPEIQVSR